VVSGHARWIGLPPPESKAMLPRGTGWPHFAQICPASTVRFAASFPSVPNSLLKKLTVPPFVIRETHRRGRGRCFKGDRTLLASANGSRGSSALATKLTCGRRPTSGLTPPVQGRTECICGAPPNKRLLQSR
jgi:hypothetical protein